MEKKSLLAVCICLLLFANTAIFAQQNDTKKAVVHLSFWDPIGTNGKEAKNFTNVFSFNVLYGLSKSEQAFTLSGLASVIKEDASGVQIAGLTNVIGDSASGVQIAGLANTVGDSASGVQIAGLVNAIGDDAYGLQIAGLVNATGANIYGLQIAGIGNKSANVEGMQIAGIFNKAKKVKGVQLGVVNIAESSDYPIGVVNLIKDGEKGIVLTFDELQNLTATFRSGGRILYGIVGLAIILNHRRI